MPLEAHYDRFVLRCGSCGEELTKPGRIAPLPEAGAAGWGLIVEPNGTYDYACSACLATILQTCTYSPQNRQDVSAFALTYILRRRSCKSPDVFISSSLPSLWSAPASVVDQVTV